MAVSNFTNAGELVDLLNKFNRNTKVLLGAWNGEVNTYCMADHIMVVPFYTIDDDIFGSQGKLDRRVLKNAQSDEDVIYIGSRFNRFSTDKDIVCGEESPNTPILELNGKDGNPYMFFERNGFTPTEDNLFSLILEDGSMISYNTTDREISISTRTKTFIGSCIGIKDFFKAVEACDINKQWIF